ncbi:MAG: alpha/beta fold hydrolase [Ornithinimicrobium sp.]
MSTETQLAPARWWRRHPIVTGSIAVVLVFLLTAGLLLLSPWFDREISAQAEAPSTYREALQRSQDLTDRDGDEVNQACRSRVVDQGERTEQAVVLLHGYTNCPAQFDVIAQAYADAGYSVVVPRLPGHGQADRLTTALSDVTPSALVSVAYDSVDIAAGLGDEVTVVGLSGGGTLTGYVAGHRDDVDRAVLIAPLIVPKALPEVTVGPASRAFRYLPDIYVWWDRDKKASLDEPPYAYPRFSFRSMGAFLAVGRAAQANQPRETEMKELVVITNQNDGAVSNVGVHAMVAKLDPRAARRTTHVFLESQGYGHDLIDPQGEDAQQLPEVYPVLGPLLGLHDLSYEQPGDDS